MHTSTQDNHLERRAFWTGTAMVVLGAFGFSAKAIFIKLAYRYGGPVDALSVLTLRMLMALPFFMLVALFVGRGEHEQALGRGDWGAVLALAFVGYYLSSFLDFSGLMYISAGLERLILFVYPTLVVIVSAFLQKRRVRRREFIALALTYAGVGLVVLQSVGAEQRDVMTGSALVFTAAITFALFTLGSVRLIHRIGAMRFTAYTMSAACLMTLLHYALTHDMASLTSLPAGVYALGLALAVLCTVIPAFLISSGMKRIGASHASVIHSGGPVATLALAAIVLEEPVTLVQAAGTALVITGIFVMSRGRN